VVVVPSFPAGASAAERLSRRGATLLTEAGSLSASQQHADLHICASLKRSLNPGMPVMRFRRRLCVRFQVSSSVTPTPRNRSAAWEHALRCVMRLAEKAVANGAVFLINLRSGQKIASSEGTGGSVGHFAKIGVQCELCYLRSNGISGSWWYRACPLRNTYTPRQIPNETKTIPTGFP